MTSGYVEMHRAWKRFRYGEVHSRLRDAIPALLRRPFRQQQRRPDGLREGEFWALRDVSFAVRPGEAVGLIGPNGAGKSTILKLLTRIHRPTSGYCRIQGRVGALIEVAAGFHPDLTGRENIFLQGVIMGMPRREIARKFDQIVAFADLAPFVETPVKRYSSGMQARLGFSIAAHLEPEVLLVDEVLAVGDAAFHAKAFEKVTELVSQQIPVVVVSHQLNAILSLCTHALLLDRGRVVRDGTPQECISAYLHGDAGVRLPPTGEGAVRIDRVLLHQEAIPSGGRLDVDLECAVTEGARSDAESVWIRVRFAQTGDTMYETGTLQLNTELPGAGVFAVSFELQMNVPPGVYLLETLVWDKETGRESFAGPSSYFQVSGAPFVGVSQLNPRVRIDGGGAAP